MILLIYLSLGYSVHQACADRLEAEALRPHARLLACVHGFQRMVDVFMI